MHAPCQKICAPRAKSKPPVAVLALGRSPATVMCWIVTNSHMYTSEEWSPRCNVTSHNTSFPSEGLVGVVPHAILLDYTNQPTHIHTHDDRRGEAYGEPHRVHSLDPRVHSPVRRDEGCVRQDRPHSGIGDACAGSPGLLSSGSGLGAFFSHPSGDSSFSSQQFEKRVAVLAIFGCCLGAVLV
jgi:hypothetical protein